MNCTTGVIQTLDPRPVHPRVLNIVVIGGVRVQLDVGLVARDSRWHCERSFEMRLAGGVVEIFFIDTNPFIVGYQNQSWANHLGEINSIVVSRTVRIHV